MDKDTNVFVVHRTTWRVSHVRQEMLTFPQHPISAFNGGFMLFLFIYWFCKCPGKCFIDQQFWFWLLWNWLMLLLNNAYLDLIIWIIHSNNSPVNQIDISLAIVYLTEMRTLVTHSLYTFTCKTHKYIYMCIVYDYIYIHINIISVL